MNIVFSSDDNYTGLMAVAMLSLMEHNREVPDLHFYVFDDAIRPESKEKLRQVTEPFGRDITYLRVPTTEELTGVVFQNQRWSSTMILRLYVGSLFPKEIKRIIFLDCDVLVLDSLRELWEMDLEGCYLGGVQECSGDKRKANLGLPPEAHYINAGVEVIDLDRLRQSDAEARYTGFIRRANGYIPEVEQGTVNACISEHIKLIHPRWNAHTTFFMFDYKTQRSIKRPTVYPSAQEVREAVENPAIVHFSGCCFSDIRPWESEKSSHPYAKAFMEYKARTPWNEPLYMGDRRSRMKRACNWAYVHLPRPLYAFAAGLGYQYLIPWQEQRAIRRARKAGNG